ncbi:BCCT family transporter [Nocardia brasiliensis]|uniref:BCCT family transporter n=1 Tax=Nocardia brasiliensis TaxID=37326 RepID=UPI0024588A59|nr:BCCT family transporter [Nocardia brasiliensis]
MATETEKTPTTPDLRLIGIGVTAVVAAAGWAALGKDSFGTVSETALNWVLGNFDWLFVVSADVFLVLCVVIAVSRFGRIRGGGARAHRAGDHGGPRRRDEI